VEIPEKIVIFCEFQSLKYFHFANKHPIGQKFSQKAAISRKC